MSSENVTLSLDLESFDAQAKIVVKSVSKQLSEEFKANAVELMSTDRFKEMVRSSIAIELDREVRQKSQALARDMANQIITDALMREEYSELAYLTLSEVKDKLARNAIETLEETLENYR